VCGVFGDEEKGSDRVVESSDSGTLKESTVAARRESLREVRSLPSLTVGSCGHKRNVYGRESLGTEEIGHASIDPRDVERRSAG
jgi:hypothetical protein